MPPLQNFLYNVQKGRKDVPSGPACQKSLAEFAAIGGK